MSLVVLKVFTDMQEAQIAAGALRAAGYHPSVPDTQVGSVYWILQLGIGGLRLCVPEEEVEGAAATLQEAIAFPAEEEEEVRYRRGSAPLWPLRTIGGLGLALLGAAPGGYLFAWQRGRRGAAAVIIGLIVLALLIGWLVLINRIQALQ